MASTFRSISHRHTRLVVAVALAVGVGVGFIQIWRDYLRVESELHSGALEMVHAIEQAASKAAFTYDEQLGGEVASGLMHLDGIMFVEITDELGNVIIARQRDQGERVTSRPPWPFRMITSELVEIKIDLFEGDASGRQVGTLRVAVSPDHGLLLFAERALGNMLGTLVTAILLTLALLLLSRRMLATPLMRMADDFSRIDPGNPGTGFRPDPANYPDNELRRVVETGNRLIKNISESVTARDESRHALEMSEANYRRLFENSEISIWNQDMSEIYRAFEALRAKGVRDLRRYLSVTEGAALDMATSIKILQVNAATLKLFRVTDKDEFISRINDLIGPNFYEIFTDQLCANWDQETYFRSEVDFRDLDGRDFAAIISFKIPETEDGFASIPVSVVDITAGKQAAAKSRILSRAVEHNPAAVMIADTDGNIEYVNPKFETMTGYLAAETIGRNPRFLQSGNKSKDEYEDLWKTILSGQEWRGEFQNKRKDGTLYWESALISAIKGADGSVEKFVAVKEDITEKKISAQLLADTIESIADGVVLYDRDDRLVLCNSVLRSEFSAFAGLLVPGTKAGSLIRANIELINEELPPHVVELQVENLIKKFQEGNFNFEQKMRNGHIVQVTVYKIDGGGTLVFRHDVTEEKQRESQLRQSQKMEVVGQLTSGIAHDFNNLLSVMIGNAEILQDKVGDDEKSRRNIAAIIRAVERGATLTERMLAFSRKQTLVPGATKIDDLLFGLEDMLRRSLGETVNLRIDPAADLWLALVDSSQLEHALVNMAVNARHAMPGGGVLAITAGNTVLDAGLEADFGEADEKFTQGDYVKISVTDTGTGMAPTVVAKIFEPFFTTKDVGAGSGLGLSMVYGFVKQSKGHITIDSEIGKGSTFTLYLPRSENLDLTPTAKKQRSKDSNGSGDGANSRPERILVVEDNEELREIPVSVLRDQGYEVHEAATGTEALSLLEGGQLKDQRRFDLLFTDIVLPDGLSGIDIADEAKKIQPGIKIIFATGYAESDVVDRGRVAADAILIRKPYRIAELVEKISETMGR